MRKNRMIVMGLLLVVAVVAFFVIRSLNQPAVLPNQELSVHKLPASPDVSTVTYDDKNGSIIFSNGRYLVSYDPSSQTTQRLTSTTSLPPVNDIKLSPNGQYIALQTDEQIDSKTLQQLLGPEGLVDAPTWWLVNLSTHALSPVGQNIANVQWDGSRLLYIFDQTVVSLDPDSGEKRVLYASDLLQDFHKYGDELLLLDSDGNVKNYNLTSGDEKTLGAQSGFVVFGNNSSCYLSTLQKEREDHLDLYLNNCGTKNHDKLATLHEDFFGFTEDSTDIVYEENDEIFVLSDNGNIKHNIILNGPESNGIPIRKAFAKNVLLLANDTSYYLATTKPFSVKVIEQDEKFSESNITFELSAADQFITISKAGAAFADPDKLLAQNILSSHSYDSNLYRLFYYTH